MKQITLFFILAIHLNSCNAQEKTDLKEGDRVMLGFSSSMKSAQYILYNPHFRANIIYGDLAQVTNSTPELLISSIISAQNQDWVNFNTFGGEQKSKKIKDAAFKRIKNMSDYEKETNFMELVGKMDFTANGTEMCIVKYYVHSDLIQKPISGTYLFQKIDTRWYHTTLPWATNLMVLLMSFDDSRLEVVFRGKPVGKPLMDDLIKKVHKNGTIDLNTLFSEYESWYKNEDVKRKDYFLDKNAWTY